MAVMDELVLRTLVIQFDGRVVEVFGMPPNEPVRQHVATMNRPVIHAPNRKGRRLIKLGTTAISVDADEMEQLSPLLDRIISAISTARADPTS